MQEAVTEMETLQFLLEELGGQEDYLIRQTQLRLVDQILEQVVPQETLAFYQLQTPLGMLLQVVAVLG
jgi:hypothetical protein